MPEKATLFHLHGEDFCGVEAGAVFVKNANVLYDGMANSLKRGEFMVGYAHANSINKRGFTLLIGTAPR